MVGDPGSRLSTDPNWFQRFLLPGFALKAVIIGGGYATGRELAEYFVPSGPWGGLAAMALATLIWSIGAALTFALARQFGAYDYRAFFRGLLGPGWIAFEGAYLVFVILILAVFGAAAGAIGAATFGWPEWAGAVLLAAAIVAVVTWGTGVVEQMFKYVSILLYTVYGLFLILALASFGGLIGQGFANAPSPSGHWMARYVPAHLRRYPFVMAEAAAAPQGEGASEISHIVVVDADAPHLSADEGDRLFNDAGEPSEALLKVQRVLLMMERDNLRTLAMVAQLEAAGLLVPQQVTVAKKQGQHIGLQGLRVVDAERLAALEPQALADLQRSGALELVYAHRLSLANLQDGVLCEAQEAEPLGGSSGSISFEGIDWSKF